MAALRPSTGRYAFDRFQLAADGTLLLKGDTVVPLAPKVLQTLLVLVQHAGEVVTKDELLQTVWPDCIVEETGLARNVSLLRQALDDDGRRFVATVARVGYRFAAPVQFVHPGTLAGRAPRVQLIVGRDHERQRLLDAVARAARGAGGMIALAGEPGIGKTTVVEQVLEDVGGQCIVGRGRSSEQLAGAEAHVPILEALHDLARTATTAGILRRTAPTWAAYLQLEGSEFDDGRPVPQSAGNPERLLRELTHFLETLARQQTVVLFLDDLHWADVATVDALAHLAPRLGRMHVLIAVTYRQSELALAGHPLLALRGELIARGELEEVRVSLLGLDDVASYVRATFTDGDVPPDLARLVFARSEGNPLFMTALLQFLSASSSLGPSDVPDSLRGLIDRMLQRLEPQSREILSVAAVQGYEFDSATIAQAVGLSAADVEERLRAADQTHALVVRERDAVLPDGTVTVAYRFVHALYQSALLASLTASRQMTWASRVADALVQTHAEQTDLIAGQLATLFEQGRDHAQAARHFLAASRNAARLFAFANASHLSERGLHCLALARDLDDMVRTRIELGLTFARLSAVSGLHGIASTVVESLTRRTVALAERLDDAASMAMALRNMSLVRLAQGECGAAREAGIRLITLGRSAGDTVLLVNAHMQAQIACHHLGEFAEAADHAATVARLGPTLTPHERFLSIFDPVVASLAESARNLWITGSLARAPVESARAVALGRDVGHPESLAFAWLFDAWIHGYRGDWPACLRSAAEGIAIALDGDAVQTLAWNRSVRGWALAHTGEVEAGRAELAEAIAASQAMMGEVAMPQIRTMMAEVHLLRGDIDAADQCLSDALASGRSHDDRYFAAEVHRLVARCAALRDGEGERVRSCLWRALALAREQGAHTFALRAALQLSSLDAAQGLPVLREVLDGFPEPEPWPDVLAAREVLAGQHGLPTSSRGVRRRSRPPDRSG